MLDAPMVPVQGGGQVVGCSLLTRIPDPLKHFPCPISPFMALALTISALRAF